MSKSTKEHSVNPRTGNVTLVVDENGLPAWPDVGTTRTIREYARLKSDRGLMQDYHNGDLFARRDGRDWPHAGYRVINNRLAGRIDREPATAWANSDERPDEKKSAA